MFRSGVVCGKPSKEASGSNLENVVLSFQFSLMESFDCPAGRNFLQYVLVVKFVSQFCSSGFHFCIRIQHSWLRFSERLIFGRHGAIKSCYMAKLLLCFSEI